MRSGRAERARPWSLRRCRPAPAPQRAPESRATSPWTSCSRRLCLLRLAGLRELRAQERQALVRLFHLVASLRDLGDTLHEALDERESRPAVVGGPAGKLQPHVKGGQRLLLEDRALVDRLLLTSSDQVLAETDDGERVLGGGLPVLRVEVEPGPRQLDAAQGEDLLAKELV